MSAQTYTWNAVVYDYNGYPPEKLATNALIEALEEWAKSGQTKETVVITGSYTSGSSKMNIAFTKVPYSTINIVIGYNSGSTATTQLTSASISPVEVNFGTVINSVEYAHIGKTIAEATGNTYTDDKYIYQMTIEAPKTLPTLKSVAVNGVSMSGKSDAECVEYVLASGVTPVNQDTDDATIEFTIPSTPVVGLNSMSDEDVNVVKSETYYKFMIISTSSLIKIIQIEDESSNWAKKNTEVTVGGIKYYYALRDTVSEQTNLFDPDKQSDPGERKITYRITY